MCFYYNLCMGWVESFITVFSIEIKRATAAVTKCIDYVCWKKKAY